MAENIDELKLLAPDEIMDTSQMKETTNTRSVKSVNASNSEQTPAEPKAGVLMCIKALREADDEEDDNQKFAALLLVTKVIKAETIDAKSMTKLFQAMGIEFLIRLLRNNDLPEGCPVFIYKSVALSILNAFVSTVSKKSVFYVIIPDLLDIIADPHLNEKHLIVVQDSFNCLSAIATNKSGRRAIIDAEGLDRLVDIYVDEGFSQEMAMNLLLCLMISEEGDTWEDSPEAFTKLVEHLCVEFSNDQSARKFELCTPLIEIVRSMPDSVPGEDGYAWQLQLHKGLADILLSKLGKEQRNQGLQLGSAVLESMGVAWMVAAGSKGHQLLLIMVHLACVEVRMSLENEKLENRVAMAPLTTSCYSILETAIKFLVNGAVDMDEKQKQQLYAALKGAFNAVMFFLKEISEEQVHTDNLSIQMFVCATIRVLGAWLAEETSANKEEVYNLLPFLMSMARYNFEWNKRASAASIKQRGKHGDKSTAVKELPDLLRFLLPGLCHLTAEDEPRHILLQLNIEEILFEYFTQKYDHFIVLVGPKTQETISSLITTTDSVCDTLVTTCAIFMNMAVTCPETVQTKPVYLTLLRSIFTKVPVVPIATMFLPLCGNMCVLGLMILRQQMHNIRNSEFGIFRFVQSVVRFLWEAHNIEESPDYNSLVVSAKYLNHWGDLMELWFLGMHNLVVLVSQITWLTEFLLECDWPQTMVATLALVRPGSVDPALMTAFEDVLCSIVRNSQPATQTLKNHSTLSMATAHEMASLVAALNS